MEQLPSSRYLVPECPGLGVKFSDSGFALVSILTHASVSIRSSGQGPRLPWNIFLSSWQAQTTVWLWFMGLKAGRGGRALGEASL